MRACALSLVLMFASAPSASAEERIAPEADFRRFTDWLWFSGGAVTAFVEHELGHVVADLSFGKSISFVEVKLGPFPFFAIQPCCNLTPREEWVIGGAGFMMQDLSTEIIFGALPNLRSRHHPFFKGLLVCDIALSLGYAVTAFSGVGPPQSDVNTMARGLGVPPWQVGLILVGPALVDIYRYLVPKSSWAPYVSIQGKAALFAVSFAL